MSFKKYNSIENSYQAKTVNYFTTQFPELKDVQYIAREKLDGANLQLFFTPGEKDFQVGKRSSFVEKGDAFFDVWATLANYTDETERLQSAADATQRTIRVYGEIYGPGINGRIDYGPKKMIKFFDVEIGDELLSQHEMEKFIHGLGIEMFMLPPMIKFCAGLNEVLKVDVEQQSREAQLNGVDKKDNPLEGVVIQPYHKVYRSGHDRFILKYKGKKFKEKEATKNNSPKVAQTPELTMLCNEFRSYINENRVLSVFSKHGPITDQNQMGDYIRWVLEDAKEDFWKDHEGLVIDDKQIKIIFNVGKEVVKLLYGYL